MGAVCCCSSPSSRASAQVLLSRILLLPSLSLRVAVQVLPLTRLLLPFQVFPTPRVPLPSLSPSVAGRVFQLHRLLPPSLSCAAVGVIPTTRVHLPPSALCRRFVFLTPRVLLLHACLLSSSSYLRSISWCFSDESGSSRGSIDVEYLAYQVSSKRFRFYFCFPLLLSSVSIGIESAQ